MIELVAFDGDDTLWHNESIFSMTQERFTELMQPYVKDDDLHDRLFATEMRNLRLFGYGVKSFTLSMIETAIELSDARVALLLREDDAGPDEHEIAEESLLLDQLHLMFQLLLITLPIRRGQAI